MTVIDFESMSDDQLITCNDARTLSFSQNEERIQVMVRKVIWQDIVAKGPNYHMLAIKVCRYQDGKSLREAMYAVDFEYYRSKK